VEHVDGEERVSESTIDIVRSIVWSTLTFAKGDLAPVFAEEEGGGGCVAGDRGSEG